MGRMRRAGLLGAVVSFAQSPQGRRMIEQARRKYDTPENRVKLRETVAGLRSNRRGGLGGPGMPR